MKEGGEDDAGASHTAVQNGEMYGSALASPPANSCKFFIQEFLGLFFAVSHQLLYELRIAIQLRFGIQITKHLKPLHIDNLVLGTCKSSLSDPLVDFLD